VEERDAEDDGDRDLRYGGEVDGHSSPSGSGSGSVGSGSGSVSRRVRVVMLVLLVSVGLSRLGVA